MIFKRSSTHYGQSPFPETPYQKAGQVWDERIGSARIQAKNWRDIQLQRARLEELAINGHALCG